ncbi:hypothetical protein CPB86DRAFT_819259 [Serendipita vermifera]|nr:hypothetical protein CPB86DRAFT_819259 [Serendipita vermifera]
MPGIRLAVTPKHQLVPNQHERYSSIVDTFQSHQAFSKVHSTYLSPDILYPTTIPTVEMTYRAYEYDLLTRFESAFRNFDDKSSPSDPEDRRDKTFGDSYLEHYNTPSMQFFVPDIRDEVLQSPLFSPLSSSPITSESSFGGISRRNTSEEPTSPATSDY